MKRQFGIHPDMNVILEAQKGPPPASVEEQRRQWMQYTQKLSRPPPHHLVVQDVVIETGHRDVPCRIYRANAASGAAPLVLYMHGGGFVLGDLDSSDSIAWGLAEGTSATVISVDYRLAPEFPWPAAFDDCYGVLKRIVDRADDYAIDASRIALAGDSAGGHLVASMCLQSKYTGGPQIAGQAMIYGGSGGIQQTQSADDFAEGFGYTTAGRNAFCKAVFPDTSYDQDPIAWPVRAPDLSRLPPALVLTAELDPIRDDGRIYAAALVRDGSPVVFREAQGMIHGFMRARFHSKAVAAEFDFICRFLKSCLEKRE